MLCYLFTPVVSIPSSLTYLDLCIILLIWKIVANKMDFTFLMLVIVMTTMYLNVILALNNIILH